MATDNPSSVPVQPSHYNSTGPQSAQPFGGIDSAGPYPVMNYANALPPTNSTGYNNPSHLTTGPAIAPGPPLEQYALETPEVPNGRPPGHVPPPDNVAGSSRGNASLVHPRVSVTEDLKNMASHYLHNPSSHVDKLRMRRSRSGTVKVLILLEIDDTM
ncbi:hypothetical protein DFH94DRAFT_732542 [Russula ochroleuca]|uniref:Uncharacterized protein n=1 Tax=Russula ochroleuca TaxID=152965 RepID=A0A9P5MY50_9AGAM|nr:hypothetical protein DFH94DRAFT_732542 [Russula ochroleuca]